MCSFLSISFFGDYQLRMATLWSNIINKDLKVRQPSPLTAIKLPAADIHSLSSIIQSGQRQSHNWTVGRYWSIQTQLGFNPERPCCKTTTSLPLLAL